MSWQDAITLFTFALAIGGLVFALGKQAQSIATNTMDINNIGKKLEKEAARCDRRLDENAMFTIRVDQRVANLERQVYGDGITDLLRSSGGFSKLGNKEDNEAG